MKKSADAVRTIGEACLELDLKPHILRYWEEQFPMLKPMKRSGGRRYYRPDDITLLRKIDTLLNKEGYTIKGAKKVLKGRSKPATADNGSIELAGFSYDSSMHTQLLAIRKTLADALA